MRKDAERNRQRLLEAADVMFSKGGVEVSVRDIADAAGVGHTTLFRNFKTKDELVAAVYVERLEEVLAYGQRLLAEDPNDAEVVFTYVAGLVHRQEQNHALIQTMTDDVLSATPGLDRVRAALLELLTALMDRGKRAGSIRPEATPTDMMVLVKGLCMNPPASAPPSPETRRRHLDLVRAAMTTAEHSRPLRGEPGPPPL
jgi:AcrR family transcriptional regulator